MPLSPCAAVIEDLGYVEGQCDHRYRSLVLWGKMGLVKDMEEKQYGMGVLLEHLERHPEEIRKNTLSQSNVYKRIAVLRMDIVQICGKKHV